MNLMEKLERRAKELDADLKHKYLPEMYGDRELFEQAARYMRGAKLLAFDRLKHKNWQRSYEL